jgi:hypothetical protein
MAEQKRGDEGVEGGRRVALGRERVSENDDGTITPLYLQ